MRPARPRARLLGIALAVVTLGVYAQVVRFEFINLDDTIIVGENPWVEQGITSGGILWAFTTGFAGNWYPLTWVSHMLDAELYGLDPGGHHATSALLHVLNTLLLFGVLRSMTRDTWPSAFVAALFALHPLHVESVAWVFERKDVLSTSWGLLAMLAYAGYTRHGGTGRYLLVTALLAAGLMSKPMLVTLPVVFLLLDYWPLERLAAGDERGAGGRPGSLQALLLEKVPWFGLSALSSVITLRVQSLVDVTGASGPTALAGLPNALVSYVRYIGKTLWPADLMVLYPHPNLPELGGTPLAAWQVAGAGVVLVALSVLVFRARRHRYLVVGWLWYLVTLLPVIGLVQVGRQAMADRYTYVPLVGLFIALAWGVQEICTRAGPRRAILFRWVGTLGVAVVAACAVATWRQVGVWRDSVTLYEHALAVNPRSSTIQFLQGSAFHIRGELKLAARHYAAALAVNPDYARAHTNLGEVLGAEGHTREALVHFRRAVEIEPDAADAHYNLANALQSARRYDEAIAAYRAVLRIAPSARVHLNLGNALRARGQDREAMAHYRQALRLRADYARAHYALGNALAAQGRRRQALKHYRRTVALEPDHAEAHHNLASALLEEGEPEAAIVHYQRVLEIRPDHSLARRNLAVARRRAARAGAAETERPGARP